MFEENENIYPVKPELVVKSVGQNRGYFVLFLLVLFLFSIDLIRDSYLVLLELLLVFIVHELGHFIMMRFYRTQAQGMFFLSLLSKFTKNLNPSESLKQQTYINLMGPLPGILIGSGLLYLMVYLSPNLFLIELALLFIGINLINLLPLDPFDGGRIIGGFYFSKNDQLKMSFTLFSSLTLIILGIVFSLWPIIVFGFVMGFKVRTLQKSAQLHNELTETEVDFKKDYKDLTNREYWMIRKAFIAQNPRLREMIPSGYTLWENERLLVEQVRQLLRIKIQPDMSTLSKVNCIVLMILLILIPLYIFTNHYEIIQWYIDYVSI